MRIGMTNIPDVLIITPDVYSDERGYFMETYNQREFSAAGIPTDFKQDNFSSSKLGTVRGLHYQLEQTQGKLICALVGEVYNVALDIRGSSPTFGKWVGWVLSAESKQTMWVPPGFAHGLMALSPVAEVMYKTTDHYHPRSQRSIYFNDPDLAIPWPITDPARIMLSDRDRNAPMLKDAEVFG